MNLNSIRSLTAAASLLTVLLTGCHVVNNKNGKNDNVDISTPFGSMQVKTNDAAETTAIGLSVYPGATPIKDGDKKHDSADVNMSFGDFHLVVKAASFQTTDSTDKVIAFYRKDLGRYGDVIECKDNAVIGSPTRTSQGLGCNDDSSRKYHTHSSDSNDGIELRAGSDLRQHIVGIETKNNGTHIGLVMINLPSQLKSHDAKDAE